MSVAMVISIGRDTVLTLVMMGAPMLAVGALIGIVMSMIQTVTQLKDQSLTTIPKILGVLVVTIIATPFLIKTIVGFTNRVFSLAIHLGSAL